MRLDLVPSFWSWVAHGKHGSGEVQAWVCCYCRCLADDEEIADLAVVALAEEVLASPPLPLRSADDIS